MASTPRELALTCAAMTDVGKRRERNEDAVLALPHHGVFCLADGMGGAIGGREASQQIMRCVELAAADLPLAPEPPDPVSPVTAALHQANLRIYDFARRINALGMGSTVVAMLFSPTRTKARVLHAGDSRAYLCRKGKLQRLTRDHTLAAEIGLGDEDRIPSFLDGMLTRAIGLAEEVELASADVRLRPDDLLLLCSDGLNKHLPDADLAEHLTRFPEHDVHQIAESLIGETLDRGAIDNVSVVVIGLQRLPKG